MIWLQLFPEGGEGTDDLRALIEQANKWLAEQDVTVEDQTILSNTFVSEGYYTTYYRLVLRCQRPAGLQGGGGHD